MPVRRRTRGRVVPTHVGVYRRCEQRFTAASRCPHARGGVPKSQTIDSAVVPLSPRTWGCTGVFDVQSPSCSVVPTHVGVYRPVRAWRHRGRRCPHARGGVPSACWFCPFQSELSPRTWGCTGLRWYRRAHELVVPTHVGVYRNNPHFGGTPISCPHARGGVPEIPVFATSPPMLSPRTWGCTDEGEERDRVLSVVPTHVGVYRPEARSPPLRVRCPHARGGVPTRGRRCKTSKTLSPRTWGCTEHEDELRRERRRCPHARGGVPRATKSLWYGGSLSPRTWGCTARVLCGCCGCLVVPTHVGVYRPA